MVKQIGFLFHMYQPPWQDKAILEDAWNRSYCWVIPFLARQKNFKAVVNINYSLTELLVKNGLDEVIDNLGEGLENGSIEITGTAAYHPILPLIPEDEVKRQIEINNKKHEEIFQGVWNPKGFFPPELAFSSNLARMVKEMGYEWIITEDIVYDIERKIPTTSIATLDDLPVFFRSSTMSNKFSFPTDGEGKPINTLNAEKSVKWLNAQIPDGSYAILAMDMETIGLHHYYTQETLEYIAQTIQDVGIESVHISSLLKKYPWRLEMDSSQSYEGSWSTTEQNIFDGVPFPLWKDPYNKIHELQWQLVEYALNTVKGAEGSERYDTARDLLDRGLQSCQMWWAAPKNIKRDDYKPGNILDGSKLLYDAIMAVGSVSAKEKAGMLYQDLTNLVPKKSA